MQELFRLARHLAFIALVARAVMPMGWMPAAQGLTICSVDGPRQEIPAQDGQAQHDVQKDACPFAAAPQLASTPDAPSLALPVFHAFAAATDRLYAASVAARFSPASPRAPPLNA
ncbi:MAG TPA: DUF2946 family protein [Rhizomicrobium sp.]|nr:DUF2946 family protein [Rhizomicrobium sp.]